MHCIDSKCFQGLPFSQRGCEPYTPLFIVHMVKTLAQSSKSIPFAQAVSQDCQPRALYERISCRNVSPESAPLLRLWFTPHPLFQPSCFGVCRVVPARPVRSELKPVLHAMHVFENRSFLHVRKTRSNMEPQNGAAALFLAP